MIVEEMGSVHSLHHSYRHHSDIHPLCTLKVSIRALVASFFRNICGNSSARFITDSLCSTSAPGILQLFVPFCPFEQHCFQLCVSNMGTGLCEVNSTENSSMAV